MTSTPIKVGFIGLSTSGWADSILGPTLVKNTDYKLVALSTTSPTSAETAAKKYSSLSSGTVKAYHGSSDQISNDPEVDLVAVSVKTPYHKEVATTVLQAGKDLFIEWPAGRNTEETRELARLAQEKGIRNVVGLQGRYSRVVKKVLMHQYKEIFLNVTDILQSGKRDY
jgi:predicted dehydrogenase